MSASVDLLVNALRSSDRTARYHRFMQNSFKTPVTPGSILWEIAEMHRKDAEVAEALAQDYRDALEKLGLKVD